MVGIAPPLPPFVPSPAIEPVRIEVEAEADEELSPEAQLFTMLDSAKPDLIAEVYVWLAEHPMPGVDPIRLAKASFESLKTEELPEFFEQLRNSMQDDLWKVLTE